MSIGSARRVTGPGSGPDGVPAAIALSPILSARYRERDLDAIAAAAPGARLVSVSLEGLADSDLADVEVLLRGPLPAAVFDRLIARCLALLSPGGALLFSTNYRKFALAPDAVARLREVEDKRTGRVERKAQDDTALERRCQLFRNEERQVISQVANMRRPLARETATLYASGVNLALWAAFQVLDDLTDLKKSSKINEVLPELEDDREFNKRISKIAKELRIPADDVKRINDTFAWDTCRAINLAKWCFWTGNLTEKEAWDYMLRSSEIAMERCDNWQDYTLSFLIGRTIQGFDPDDVLIYSGQLLTGKSPKASVYQEVSFKPASGN